MSMFVHMTLYLSDVACGEEYITCNDYSCVHSVFRCDGIDDCRDAEDEMQCGEHYYCLFFNSTIPEASSYFHPYYR